MRDQGLTQKNNAILLPVVCLCLLFLGGILVCFQLYPLVKLSTIIYCNSIFFIIIVSVVAPNSTSIMDPRLITSIAIFFYLISAPLGKKISYSKFDPEVYLFSYFLVIIGLFGFLCSMLFWKNCYFTIKVEKELKSKESSYLYFTGLLFIALGYIFLIVNYTRIGDLYSVITMQKVDKMSGLSSSLGNLPYSVFINVGVVGILYSLLFHHSVVKFTDIINSKFIIAFLVLLPILMLWVFEGERSTILKTFIIIGAIFCVKFPLKPNISLIFLMALFFILLSFLGNIRTSMHHSFRIGSTSPITKRLSQISTSWFFTREFSANYFSVTGTVWLNKPLLLGESYVFSVPYLLPRTLYPGKKPKTISHSFGKTIAQKVGRQRRFGVGFSPIAEGYANFGVVGAFISLFAWGLLIPLHCQLLRFKNHFALLFYAASLPLALLFFRSSFASSVSFLFRLAIVISIYLVLYHTVTKLKLLDYRFYIKKSDDAVP